jgi:ferredoxin
VNAIYADGDMPAEFAPFLELNARLAKEWPVLAKSHEPLPDAEKWKDAKNKLEGLDL